MEVVREDGDPIRLDPGSRRVLAALALRPRQVVPAETLIDQLWPGVEDRIARHRLHTAVSKLRRTLGAG